MQGQILGRDADDNIAFIIGNDQKRYQFQRQDWRGERPPAKGLKVDFEIDGSKARRVFPLPTESPADRSTYREDVRRSDGTQQKRSHERKNKLTATILAFPFGIFGLHKFYLGHIKSGIFFMLCLFPGMFLIFPVFFTSLISLIEAIIYAVTSDEEFYEKYEVRRQTWF